MSTTNEPQASLGGVIFGLSTSGLDTIKRTIQLKWPGIDRVQNRPKKQFTGIGEETVVLDGNFYPDVHGENVIPRLRALSVRGNPMILVLGTGQNLGMWSIVEIGGVTSHIRGGGKSRKFEFTITLEYYPG